MYQICRERKNAEPCGRVRRELTGRADIQILGPPDRTLGRVAVFLEDIARTLQHRLQLLDGEVVAVLSGQREIPPWWPEHRISL